MGKTVSQLIIYGLVVMFLGGCQTLPNEKREEIVVAAASSLYHAFEEIGAEFEREKNIGVSFTFGSSGLLSQQIEQGAPYDLFASADERYIDKLVEQERMIAESKTHFAIGSIVFLYKSDHFQAVDADLLLDSKIQTIGIAQPEHAPYGQAAKESLMYWEIWDEIKHKLVFADNVRHVNQLVESGNVDVGITAAEQINEIENATHKEIDRTTYSPIVQTIGVTAQAATDERAQMFIEFLLGEQGQQILSKHGFLGLEQ